VSSVAAESDPEPCHQYPPIAFARCGKECKRWPEVGPVSWIGRLWQVDMVDVDPFFDIELKLVGYEIYGTIMFIYFSIIS